MNAHEARLYIVSVMTEILFDLSDGDDLSDAERKEIRESLADAADLIVEALDINVVSVDGRTINVTMTSHAD